MIRTLTIAFALMLAVACGGDAVPATSIPATATPIATFAPSPTTEPTPTPVKMAVFQPNPDLMPLGIPLGDLTAQQYEILGYTVANFPPEMERGEPFLGADQVVELWEDFLSGARMETQHQSTEVLYCSNGQGIVIREDDQLVGRVFLWEMSHSPASRLNDILLMSEFVDGKGHPRFDQGPMQVHRQRDENVAFGGGGEFSEPGFESIVVKDPDCESYLP